MLTVWEDVLAHIEPEPTIRSETVFQGKLIDVRKDTVRLPDGKTTEREIVVHPEVIAVLPLLGDGQIVFVRQYRKAAERILLEIPAGGVEPGETPEDAVRREMIEETGYRVDGMTHLVSFYTSPGFTTELMHLYRAYDLHPGTPTEETDQIEVVELTLAQALERLRNGEIADAKTVAALGFCTRLESEAV
jgi:ADP-ribose pyrophosphatase